MDASAWFAIPGLVEAHTHVATSANRARAEFLLNRQLYGGVTTARDMAGDVRSLMDLQRASLVKEIPAPDLHFAALMAGPGFLQRSANGCLRRPARRPERCPGCRRSPGTPTWWKR